MDVVSVSGDLGRAQVSTTSNIYCHMFQEAQARTSQAIAELTKRKSRELTNLNYLRKDHYKDQIKTKTETKKK